MSAMLMRHALLWPLVVPLAAAALCMLLWRMPRAQRHVHLAACTGMLAAALLLLGEVQRQGVVAMAFGGWMPPFGIVFVADRLGAALVVVTALLALAAAVYALATTPQRQQRAGLYPLLLGLLAAVNGAFLTGDIFNLYVWFEILLITALGLLTLERRRASLDAALRYAVPNLICTLLLLLGIALLYGVTGTLNLADLARLLPQRPPSAALAVSAALLLLAFALKAGCFPLFFWLPASYHTLPIAVLALFAGLLTKVGVYACFRVFTLLADAGEALRGPLLLIAAGTMLFGVLGAAVQWDVRRILAFHIISQIGYILLGLALGTVGAMAAAIFYLLHHIVVKANLFLIAGAMQRAGGSYDLRRSGGLLRQQPLLALCFAVPALSLAGLPPLSGFWAKWLVVDASLRADAPWLAALALVVGLLTLFSMSKIWVEAFWKPRPGALVRSAEEGSPQRRLVPLPMWLGIGTLAALTLWIGLQPETLVRFAGVAAQALLDPRAYVEAGLQQGPAPLGVAGVEGMR